MKKQQSELVTKRLNLLQKYYEMACHNLLCYSQNYLMTIAKVGFETEWEQAEEECRLLKEMIKEQTAQELRIQGQQRNQKLLDSIEGDHVECAKCGYLNPRHHRKCSADAPPITVEAIEKFYEEVCQRYRERQKRNDE